MFVCMVVFYHVHVDICRLFARGNPLIFLLTHVLLQLTHVGIYETSCFNLIPIISWTLFSFGKNPRGVNSAMTADEAESQSVFCKQFYVTTCRHPLQPRLGWLCECNILWTLLLDWKLLISCCLVCEYCDPPFHDTQWTVTCHSENIQLSHSLCKWFRAEKLPVCCKQWPSVMIVCIQKCLWDMIHSRYVAVEQCDVNAIWSSSWSTQWCCLVHHSV